MSLVVAQRLVAIVGSAGLGVANQTVIFMTGMMVGAGTDYAVFLISRYHDYLRQGVDSDEAVSRTLTSIGKVIAASAATVAITFLGWQMKTGREFLILAALVGTVQGGTQALSRSLFSRMIPAARSGEFFGFFAIFEKFAGIFGPLLFSVAIYATGSTRTAILTTLVFFIAGALLLLKVDVARGEREAA